MQTGQWLDPRDGTRWFFDSGSLALDFGWTGAFGGSQTTERMHAPADLHAWLAERFEHLEPAADPRNLQDALLLREAIVRIAAAIADGGSIAAEDVDAVNLYAATPDVPPSLDGGRRQAGRSVIRLGQALSTIARDAVALFAEHADDGRIHRCSADDCGLLFYDDSRSANRRWCSMQRCGNRAKVRAHRARARA
jgi:predicted RNA-binding Zn ribbon-like protein